MVLLAEMVIWGPEMVIWEPEMIIWGPKMGPKMGA